MKKCIPITRSGRDVTAASEVIGIDEVFEARIASGGSTSVGGAEELLLRSGVLDDRLDHEVGRHELGGLRDAHEDLVRGGAALRLQPLEARAHGLETALDRSREGIVQQHLPPRGGDDLGDSGAHLAGADDEDALEAHRGSVLGGGAFFRRSRRTE